VIVNISIVTKDFHFFKCCFNLTFYSSMNPEMWNVLIW